MNPSPRPRILLLFSDTGGGHRSAAEAIVEALELEFGDRVETEMLDFFKEYAPAPFNRAPALYPNMVKAPRLWELGFYITDGRPQARAMSATLWPYVARNVRALVRNHPSDLVVTVHPFANSLILKALGRDRPPFITVVTDLVTTHAFWFDQRADLIIVPTEQARRRAIEYHMSPEKVRTIGFPVKERYCVPVGDKRALRARLGWPQDIPIVLLVGGGEGMGPLRATAHAIAGAGLDLGLVIVTGRNHRLKAELEMQPWPVWTQVLGFTREMPDLMRAADVLVSKAGTSTVCEALNAGLPTILYARLPGQEDGNAVHLLQERAGTWAPTPERVVRALRRWIEQPQAYARAVAACRQAARPQAARAIARVIGAQLGLIEARTELLAVDPSLPPLPR